MPNHTGVSDIVGGEEEGSPSSTDGHLTRPRATSVVVLDPSATTTTIDDYNDTTSFGGGGSGGIISAHSSFAASGRRLSQTSHQHASSGTSNVTTGNVSFADGGTTPQSGAYTEMSLSVSPPSSPINHHNGVAHHHHHQHQHPSPSSSYMAGSMQPTLISEGSLPNYEMESSSAPTTTTNPEHQDNSNDGTGTATTPESRFAAAFHKYFLSGDYTIEECALAPEDTLRSIVDKYQKLWGTHRVTRLDIMRANFLAVHDDLDDNDANKAEGDDQDVDASIKGIPSKILKVPILAALESELTSPSVALEPIRARRNTAVACEVTPTHSGGSSSRGGVGGGLFGQGGGQSTLLNDDVILSSSNKPIGRRAHRSGGSRPRLLSLHVMNDHQEGGSGALMSPAITGLPKFAERLGSGNSSQVGVSPVEGVRNNNNHNNPSTQLSHLDLHSRAGSERLLGAGGAGSGVGIARRSRNNLFDLSLHSQAASMAGYSMISSVDAFSPEFARVLSTSSWQNTSHLSTPVVRGQNGMPFMGSLSLVSRRSMSLGEVPPGGNNNNNNNKNSNNISSPTISNNDLGSGVGGGGGMMMMGLPSIGGPFELPIFTTASSGGNLNRSVLYSPETPLDSAVLLPSPVNIKRNKNSGLPTPPSPSSAAHSKLHPHPTPSDHGINNSLSAVGLVALSIPHHLGGESDGSGLGGSGDGGGAYSLASMYGSAEGSQTPRGAGNRTLTSNDVHTAPWPDMLPPPQHQQQSPPPLLPAADLHRHLKAMGVSELTAFLTDMLGPVVQDVDEANSPPLPISTTTSSSGGGSDPQERTQLLSRLLRVLNQQPGTQDTNEESFNTVFTSMSPPTAVRFLNTPSSIEHPGTPLKSTTTTNNNDSSLRLPSLVSTTQIHGTPLCAAATNIKAGGKRSSFASSVGVSPTPKVSGGLLPPIQAPASNTNTQIATTGKSATPSRPVLKSLTRSVVDLTSYSDHHHHHGGGNSAAASYATGDATATSSSSPSAMKRHLAGGAAFAVRRATIHKASRVPMPSSTEMKGGPGVAVPVLSRAPLEDRVKLLAWVERERRQQLLHQTTAAFQKLVDQHHHRWLLELEQYDRESR